MSFASAEGYERFMGRWSRRLAAKFIDFVGIDDGDRVLDVGCGTGSLAVTITTARPRCRVVGIDPSSGFIEQAKRKIGEDRIRFEIGNAQQLSFLKNSFDKTLSCLVLNHIPDARAAMAEMVRVTRQGGTVAATVWDYGGGMSMIRMFWDAAIAADPSAKSYDQEHMPYTRKGELPKLWSESGLSHVQDSSLTIPLEFSSFEDYFQPFLAGIGPSGSYATSLPQDRQSALKERLRNLILGPGDDRPFTLEASAWAVRGTVPDHQN